MNLNLGDLISILEKYGFTGALIIAIIFLISRLFSDNITAITKKIYSYIKGLGDSKDVNIKSISDSDIINHDIFNYIDFWMYSKVPTMQFSTEFRTAVFRKYLSIYLKTYKRKILEFVSNKEYQEMDNAKIWRALLDLINRIIRDYEQEMMDSGIPQIVVDKMKVGNNGKITLTIDLIEGICNSQFYVSDKNLLKVYSILNILLSVLENTISNSEGICNSINGAMRGYKYDGKTEP